MEFRRWDSSDVNHGAGDTAQNGLGVSMAKGPGITFPTGDVLNHSQGSIIRSFHILGNSNSTGSLCQGLFMHEIPTLRTENTTSSL